MPSFERSREINQRKDSKSPYSYDKIMAFFNTKADPKDTSISTRSNKVTVAFTNTANYNDTITNLPQDEYLETAGQDLSALFMPFETKIDTKGLGLPGFMKNADRVNLPTTTKIGLTNLLPFKWDKAETNHVYDRWNTATVGDGINGLISSDRVYADVNQYRDISQIRGIGLRLPIMAVGWGYTLSAAKAVPSGTETEIKNFPINERDRVFAGGTQKGWEVDPSQYIAAPIDLRYDETRDVWTCGGQGLPPGKGIYKVLMLIDDEDPGTAAWDYPRFPPIEPV